MKILVTGDFCPQKRVSNLFDQENYSEVLGDLKIFFSGVDYSIVNLECPIIYGKERPIEKQGPNLHCSQKGIEALRWLNVKCVTLANNHFFDYGEEGVLITLKLCERGGIETVGGGSNIEEASKILYKIIKGKTLAIINCCEHEFSIATNTTGGSNPLNPVKQYYAIKGAKKKADYVIVIVHGGNEYYQLPSPRMKEIYHFFVDVGADVVVNHHQHCFSGYEKYKEKYIFYGLGNFCFDDTNYTDSSWNEGYMLELIFGEKDMDFNMIPYVQCKEKPNVRIMVDEEKKFFLERIDVLNKIIDKDDLLNKEFDNFLDKKKDEVSFLFLPIVNKITLAMNRRHLLPKFVSKKNKLRVLNYLLCESHFPKVIKYIQSI